MAIRVIEKGKGGGGGGVSNARFDSAIGGIETDITAIEADITTIEADIVTIQGDITSIEADIVTIQGDITTIQGDITAIEADIVTIQGDIVTIQTDIANIQTDIANIQAYQGYRQDLIPFTYSSIGQGTWDMIILATQYSASYFKNSTDTDGDNIVYKIAVAPGTWCLHFLGRRTTGSGIVKLKVASTVVKTIDLYKAGPAQNNYIVNDSFVIAAGSDGLKDFTVLVDGKNASSGGYECQFSLIALWRNA